MSSNTSNTIIALLAGVAIGAGLGILFAPDKGEGTRRKLKDKLNEGKDGLADKVDEIIDVIQEKFTNAEQKMEDSLDDFISERKEKTEDVISVLEAKLAALKKEVKK
jgi:gas vesicle protein